MSDQKKVAAFEKKMKWDTTHSGQIALWLKKDALLLSRLNAKHKIVDIYFETLQLANRNKIKLDKSLAKHLKEAERKYNKG